MLKKRALAINNKVEIIDEEKGKPFKSIILSLGPGFFTVTLPYEFRGPRLSPRYKKTSNSLRRKFPAGPLPSPLC